MQAFQACRHRLLRFNLRGTRWARSEEMGVNTDLPDYQGSTGVDNEVDEWRRLRRKPDNILQPVARTRNDLATMERT